MALISWGKPKIEWATSVAGAPSGSWTAVDTPKMDTTELSTEAGDETTAQIEGGETLDTRRQANRYTLTFTLYAQKGKSKPFPDVNGVVDGNYAFRITPEDPECEGYLFENTTVSVEESYTPADGKLWVYTVNILKPATGDMVKPYAGSSLVATPTKLYFDGAEDQTGKTVAVTATGEVSASSSVTWATPSVSGKNVTVKVEANTTGAPRTGYVNIYADNKSCVVTVTQIPQDN